MSSSSPSSSPPLLWKCKCGGVEVKLHSQPWGCFNCHCHSCVSVVRKVDELGGGTSASSQPDGGGAAKAFFYLKDVEMPPNISEKLGYFKVGDKGTNIRTYTKCCNTLWITAGGKHFPNFRPMNRNCLLNAADGSEFEWKQPVKNFNEGHAFVPNLVPEPKHEGVPNELIEKFVPGKIEADGNPALEKEKAIFCEPTDPAVEVVPITWE